ncbi:MAG: extracellular solute-binding protein [Clostridia bacterium]|nr:extracellular solute-binding protein [Clostridia bacterium]
MKKITALAAALAIALGAASGCGKQKTADTVVVVDDPNVTAPGELPVVKDQITLRLAVPSSSMIKDYETNEYTKFLEEKTGINLEFEVLADYQNKIQIMLASNTKLPDIIFGGRSFDDNVLMKYGCNGTGTIIDLEDYMKNYGYWLDHIYTKSQEPDIEKQLVSADGHRYFMPQVVEQTGNRYPRKAWINKTWLDKLGLEMPETTDDLKEVLRAFVTQDPNGNGKADEIGITGSKDGWGAKPYQFLMNSFIYEPHDGAYGAVVGDDGKLMLNYTQPEYKKGLEYIHSLIEEGLFDTLSFTQDNNTLKAIAQQPDNVIGIHVTGSPDSVFSANPERMYEYAALPPLKGPDGVEYALKMPVTAGISGMITKYCEHPLAAFRLLDFMLSEEATIFSRYGVEGQDWDKATENDKALFEAIGAKPVIVTKKSVFSEAQNSTWGQFCPEFRFAEIADGMAWSGDPFDSEKYKADGLSVYIGKGPEKLIVKLLNTAEESEELAILRSEIKPYVETEVVAIMSGQKELESGWNSMQEKLKSMGCERMLELTQIGYDRFEGNE